MIETLIREREGRIRGLRVRRLNGVLMASLLVGPAHEDPTIAARDALVTPPEVVNDVAALRDVWRRVCEREGFTDERSLP